MDYKELPIDKLPKVQKLVYETIKQYQPISLGDLAKLVKKDTRSMSSVLNSLQLKELVVLKDHFFSTTDKTTFKVKLSKVPSDNENNFTTSDAEHDAWLQSVLKQKEQRQLRSQNAEYF